MKQETKQRLIKVLDGMKTAIEKNCGTGAGGFKPGNTCRRGGGGGSAESGGGGLEAHGGVVEKKLTPKAREAFKHYSEDIGFDINHSLRQGDELSGREHEVASLMSSAIQKHGSLPTATKVYRAMSWHHEEDMQSFLKGAVAGQAMQLKGFTSTSTDKKFVMDAFGDRPGGKVLMEITAKKGVYLGSDSMTHHLGQKELLLDNNSHFKVSKVVSKDGTHTIHLEQTA